MSSFLKSIFHSNKHKKLCEEWTSAREPVADGVTFYVRYLGCSVVEDPKSAASTASGVKRVIHAAKAGARRPERVSFRVAMDGIRIESIATGRLVMDTSIYKISYCSADSKYDQVFAFVASNEDESCECHAFLCSKRKVAEAIAVSIAQAFSMAYECWQLAVEAKRNRGESSLTSSHQIVANGGESPSRDDTKDGDYSRGSSPDRSPCHSSPPSEVSSTSGYQSSTPAGLLLELEDCERGGCADISLPAASRKHWTSFDDLSDLEITFNRLSSSQPRLCHPWTKYSGNPTATASGGCPPPQAPPLWTGTELWGTRSSALGAPAAATGRPPPHRPEIVPCPAAESASPAADSRSPTANNFLPAPRNSESTSCNAAFANNFIQSDFKTMYNLPSFQLHGQKYSATKPATSPGFSSKVDSKENSLKPLDLFPQSINSKSFTSSTNSKSFTSSTFLYSEKTSLDNSVAVPRARWESFDASPPQSLKSPNSLNISTPATPSFGSLSPTAAFLDSCLTPHPEDSGLEPKFLFPGCLSGVEHPPLMNTYPSSVAAKSFSSLKKSGNNAVASSNAGVTPKFSLTQQSFPCQNGLSSEIVR